MSLPEMVTRTYSALVLICLFSAGILSSIVIPHVNADEAGQLRSKILEHNKRLIELREEIEEYQQELNVVSQEKRSLESTINELDLSRNKVATEMRVTEEEINSTDLEIRELEIRIRERELQIAQSAEAIAVSLRALNTLGEKSMVEAFLENDTLAEFWENLAEIESFQLAIQTHLADLRESKDELEGARDLNAQKKGRLSGLKSELANERAVVDANLDEKSELLEVTQSEEEKYQQLLNDRIAAREKFLAELRTFESQLDFILNPATIPAVGSGVLAWPFATDYMLNCPTFTSALGNDKCITQYFGNTAFAAGGAYNGQGHNGIDFRAAPGTTVTAALAGTVKGTGNTDAAAGCYSYGKWVMIEHANGLSTMYAHLSHIGVTPGQKVATGDIVGYSGNTGYSTGPHLHFSVYATEGVSIQKLGDIPGRPITACSPVAIPVAGFEAYLNPLSYL